MIAAARTGSVIATPTEKKSACPACAGTGCGSGTRRCAGRIGVDEDAVPYRCGSGIWVSAWSSTVTWPAVVFDPARSSRSSPGLGFSGVVQDAQQRVVAERLLPGEPAGQPGRVHQIDQQPGPNMADHTTPVPLTLIFRLGRCLPCGMDMTLSKSCLPGPEGTSPIDTQCGQSLMRTMAPVLRGLRHRPVSRAKPCSPKQRVDRGSMLKAWLLTSSWCPSRGCLIGVWMPILAPW